MLGVRGDSTDSYSLHMSQSSYEQSPLMLLNIDI